MTMVDSLRLADERALARVDELRQVQQHIRSDDVRETIEAAIGDVQLQHDLAGIRSGWRSRTATRPSLRSTTRHDNENGSAGGG